MDHYEGIAANYVQYFADMTWYLQITSAVITFLFLVFILFFVLRGVYLWFKLGTIGRRLKRLPAHCTPNDLTAVFSKHKKLAHLWREYSETLHNQTRPGEGAEGLWRATVPAEVYFNSEIVVDSYVGADFFRHLPGIFTGIGIIGTFLGLIDGLSKFKPKNDPAETMAQIGPLIESVEHAFMISAVAIIIAMAVTVVEKFLIARLHAHAIRIAQRLDAKFDAGVGEEYLARLTKSSEEATNQAKILKDQMVQEMGEILRQVSQKQTQVVQASQQEMAGTISNAIEHSLTEPLQKMEETFKTVTGGTGERTVEMLGDVMASFSDKLNELFGSQINGLNELNRQSAEAMQNAAASLNGLVEDMGKKGQETTDQMADKMLEAIHAMETSQSGMNSRTETTLNELGDTMRKLMSSMEESHSQRLASSQQRESQMMDRASGMVEGLGENVDSAIARMSEASETMADSVQRLSATTSDAIGKLNLGADKVVQATDNMTNAGNEMKQAVGQAATLAERMSEHSSQLLASTRAVQEVMNDYQNQRRTMQGLVEQAGSIVESARKEAAITEDVLARIEQSTTNLARVQGDFDAYLEGVNRVLAQSSDAFRSAVTTTLKDVNRDFHQQLSNAVKLLNNAIGELETTISEALPEA